MLIIREINWKVKWVATKTSKRELIKIKQLCFQIVVILVADLKVKPIKLVVRCKLATSLVQVTSMGTFQGWLPRMVNAKPRAEVIWNHLSRRIVSNTIIFNSAIDERLLRSSEIREVCELMLVYSIVNTSVSALSDQQPLALNLSIVLFTASLFAWS